MSGPVPPAPRARLGADPSALEALAATMRSVASELATPVRWRPDAVERAWQGAGASRTVDLLGGVLRDRRRLAAELPRLARALEIAAIDQRRASRSTEPVEVRLDRREGGGRLVQRIGPTGAESLVVLVPGVGTDRGDRRRLAADARRVWNELVDRVDSTGGVAVVSWLGYDPPDVVVGAIDVDPAVEGADALRSWVAQERRGGARRVTVVGHSYGGVVVGRAAALGMDADVVVQLGSPGVGSPGAVEVMHRRGIDLRAVRAPGDPIGLVAGRLPGRYGEDPVGVVDGLPTAARGHGGYLSDPVLLGALARLAVDPSPAVRSVRPARSDRSGTESVASAP